VRRFVPLPLPLARHHPADPHFPRADVLTQLLERGFRVRGTVRSQDKGDYLKKLLAKDGLDSNFEVAIVEDVEKVRPSPCAASPRCPS